MRPTWCFINQIIEAELTLWTWHESQRQNSCGSKCDGKFHDDTENNNLILFTNRSWIRVNCFKTNQKFLNLNFEKIFDHKILVKQLQTEDFVAPSLKSVKSWNLMTEMISGITQIHFYAQILFTRSLRRPYPGMMQLELKFYFQLLMLNRKFKDRRSLPDSWFKNRLDH